MGANLLVAPAQLLKELISVGLGTEPVCKLEDSHRHTHNVSCLTIFVKCDTVASMTDLPPDMQARRAIEDRAVQLGNERRDLDGRLAANTQAIIDLLRDAEGSGIPYEHLAEIVGVSRQTLFRWREIASELKPSETAAQRVAKRTPEGHELHR
jgi:hypothetical protein